MTTVIYNPIKDSRRIAIVDVLRGWALLGVVLMNYTDVYQYLGSPPKPGTFDNILLMIGGIIFSAKSWTMLSFLFGYGFAILIDNVASKGVNPVKFFSRRMFWLLVIAVINSAFFFGDILKDYAVLGMVLLLFRNCSAKTAFYACIALVIINPFLTAYIISLHISGPALAAPYFALYQSHNWFDIFKSGLMGTYEFEILNPFYSVVCHEVIFLCFLLGLAAQKVNFFGRLAENKKYIKRIFWGSLAFTLAMQAMWPIVAATGIKHPFRYFAPFFWGILSTMLFLMAAICWLFISNKLRRFFSALQAFGKMTLTNYVTQNILTVILFSGVGFRLGSFGLSYGTYMLIALVIYIVQIFLSKWWLSRYNFGPLEWMWRQLSYAKKLPIKKATEPDDSTIIAANTANR
jgi:uncharacterized protein